MRRFAATASVAHDALSTTRSLTAPVRRSVASPVKSWWWSPLRASCRHSFSLSGSIGAQALRRNRSQGWYTHTRQLLFAARFVRLAHVWSVVARQLFSTASAAPAMFVSCRTLLARAAMKRRMAEPAPMQPQLNLTSFIGLPIGVTSGSHRLRLISSAAYGAGVLDSGNGRTSAR